MLFNSSEFLFFFALFFPTFWLVQKHLFYRNLLLLTASYVFYGFWDWRFLSLIVISTVVDFYCGSRIFSSSNQQERKLFLCISLFVNLGILCVFKYLGFFVDSFVDLLHSLNVDVNFWTLSIILPIGISFYTFQTLSYSIDIYYKKLEPSKSILNFATFVAFFPQLVAGPIERAKTLLPQIESGNEFSYQQLREGIFLVLWGLTKKVLIADRLAIYVDAVFADPASATGPQALIAVLFFAIQIYCDFSGYSDIARGIAKMLGFELMLNFSTPYFSTSIREYWARWHISLSTWFRDYVYIPLGGSRVSSLMTKRNLMATFVISGLWHGANYTFLFWGFLHASGQLVETGFRKIPLIRSIPAPMALFFGLVWTFSFVCFGYIFFRAESIPDAMQIIGNISSMVSQMALGQFHLEADSLAVGMNKMELGLAVYFITLLLVTDILLKDKGIEGFTNDMGQPLRWAYSWFLIVNFLMLSPSDSGSFIYFQF